MMIGKLKSFYIYLSAALFLFFSVPGAHAQNTDQVEAIFRCESIPQLIETFDWSGTRSAILQSMMRSIQNESLNSGFERQIIQELQKKPWRINTIKQLEAEFQVIKGQYNAELISEADARLRMACEFSKYLHRDYLENFDRASIFSTQSVPFAFYTYVRENELWQNLTKPDLDPENTYVEESTTPNKLNTEEEGRPVFPPSESGNTGIDTLTLLYWLFLILIGWIILSVITGSLLKNQRFTNPITRQIFNILLWPFRLIQPLLVERPPGEKKFFGLSQRTYGNPLSEEQLKLMIDNRISETEKSEAPAEEMPTRENRIDALEEQLRRLEQEQSTPTWEKPKNEVPTTDTSALESLQNKVDQLSQQLDTLSQQLNTQQQKLEDHQRDQSQTSQDLNDFRKLLQEELGKHKKDIDNKLLQLSKTIAAQADDFEDDEEEEDLLEEEPPTDGGLLSHSPGLNLEIETPEEEEEEESKEESEEEDSSAASDQLELTPLPAKDSPPTQYIYYASSPQRGVFRGQRLEPGFIPKQTVYKITVDKDNPEKASYTMVTHEPTIRLALNIMDSYIIPAMDLSGPGNIMEATEIGPVEEGELKKVDKDWHIVRKGVLHYS